MTTTTLMSLTSKLKSKLTGLLLVTRVLIRAIVVGLGFLVVGNTYAQDISIDDYSKRCADGQINLCASLGVVFERNVSTTLRHPRTAFSEPQSMQ